VKILRVKNLCGAAREKMGEQNWRSWARINSCETHQCKILWFKKYKKEAVFYYFGRILPNYVVTMVGWVDGMYVGMYNLDEPQKTLLGIWWRGGCMYICMYIVVSYKSFYIALQSFTNDCYFMP
jgi:hypothetical protein